MAESGLLPDLTETGWSARLELGFAARPERTVLAHRRHSGPLRVLRPFHPERETCHVYIVHPPGGIVGGDSLELRIHGAPGSQTLVTTPAAGKFYRSEGRLARQSVAITLEAAQLEWLPQETIYYPGAEVRQKTLIRLDAASRFIGWEVGCLGLSARSQPFDHGHIAQGFEVWQGARPLLLDQLRLDGAAPMMQARWGLAARPVIGTFVACFVSEADVEWLRETEAARASIAGEEIGLTRVDGVLVVRCLGTQADAVMRRFVALWELLRPRLMQRPAVLPRIWAT